MRILCTISARIYYYYIKTLDVIIIVIKHYKCFENTVYHAVFLGQIVMVCSGYIHKDEIG
jgi:hypothetical protein